jgi:hypothetical protein
LNDTIEQNDVDKCENSNLGTASKWITENEVERLGIVYLQFLGEFLFKYKALDNDMNLKIQPGTTKVTIWNLWRSMKLAG